MKSFCSVTTAIQNIALILREKSSDYETLDIIVQFCEDRGHWQKAHGLFDHIRAKSIKAQESQHHALISQYRFEEICAKTLYNLGRHSAPFDPDSPYWIIPCALDAAEYLGIPGEQIWKAIQTEQGAAANH